MCMPQLSPSADIVEFPTAVISIARLLAKDPHTRCSLSHGVYTALVQAVSGPTDCMEVDGACYSCRSVSPGDMVSPQPMMTIALPPIRPLVRSICESGSGEYS